MATKLKYLTLTAMAAMIGSTAISASISSKPRFGTTQLADLYDPIPFENGVNQISTELNAFAASGVMVADPRLNAMVAVGGMTGEMPYYNDLAAEDPNLTSDDPSQDAVPSKISSSAIKYRLAKMHKHWSSMDFASEVTSLGDPKGQIISSVGRYWARVSQKRLTQSALGVMADNVANDNGDMVYDHGGPITEMAIEFAAQTMGDHKGNLKSFVCHSVVETQLRAIEAIKDFHDPKTGDLMFSMFNGRRLVVDDSMPKIGLNYVSLLFAGGAFRYGTAAAEVPSELERNPEAGNGGGESLIHSRQNYLIQPVGVSCEGTPAAKSFTAAELATAGIWDRKYERKNVPFAFLLTTD